MTLIKDRIEILKKYLSKGYNYLGHNFFGLNVLTVSKKEFKSELKFYIVISQHENDWDLDPKHQEKIQVDVLKYDFDFDKDGAITCHLELKPLQQLPTWYLSNEYYMENYYEDFQNAILQNLFVQW